jgi:uncharacterized membrane-anchored protein
MTLPRFAWLAPLLALVTSLFAQEAGPTGDSAAETSYVDKLRDAGISITTGPATIALGSIAELQLPADHHSIDRKSLKRFYELTQNVYGGDEVGVIIGPTGWMLFFDYDDVGYVKDDDKDELDAAKLLETMRENQDASNAERAKQGWDELKLAGWAAEPYYDPQTNNLKWALTLTSSGDNHQSRWINESIRLLGRGGVMNVTLVTDPDTFAVDARTTDTLLAQNFSYVSGQKYSEFKEGDKVAKYGLAALVLGGAGAAAFKLGFFQKFWKFLVAGALALAAGAKKLWNKISGSRPANETPDA